MTKQVYIIDDLEWLRELLAQYLSMQPELEVCGMAANAEEALAQLPAGADVVIVDLGLGEGLTGLELVAVVRERWPDLPCIVLSGQSEAQVGAAVHEAGAAGYAEKGDEEHLVETIYDILGINK